MEGTLERSVLERKERDELSTIATALGMKPSGRAKKETLIDQILKTAGVVEAPVADAKPKRGRKPASSADVTGSDVPGSDSAPSDSGSGTAAAVQPDLPAPPEPASRDPRTPTTRPDGPRRGPKPGRNSRPSSTLFDPFAEADASKDTAAPYADDDEAAWAFAAAKPAGRDLGGQGDARGMAGPSGTTGAAGADVVVATPSDLLDEVPADGGRPGRDRFRDRPDRGPRPERPDRPEFADRPDRSPRNDGARNDRGDRPDRPDRPEFDRPRNDGPRNDGPRNDRGPRPDRPDRGPRPERQDRGPQQQSTFNAGSEFETDRNGRKRRRRGRDRDRQVTPQGDAFADRASESYAGELIPITGLLDLADQGYGYIRANGYLPSPEDVYVPVNRVRAAGLRKGDLVVGSHRPALPQEKFPAIVDIDTVNGHHPDVAKLRPKFEDLTPLFPDVKLRLEQPGQPGNMVARIIDLVSPIGKGQRGLIVSPPKAGKTTIMKQIASSIEMNNPDVHLMVLLIDERPEEVTDMRRHVQGEVIASTFDKPAEEHTIVAELALDRAKRLVEEGKDVVIILDGITRLARAYNLAAPATGRIMSGGIDTGALYPPKKFFGAARNIDEGGSLTILATALVETGSTMDTVIFEEFKGTGNMELRLDRRLAEKRIYPAINVNESSTRHEELLFQKQELDVVWKLRRVLNGLAEGGSGAAGLELLMDRIKTTKTNSEFLMEIAKAPQHGN